MLHLRFLTNAILLKNIQQKNLKCTTPVHGQHLTIFAGKYSSAALILAYDIAPKQTTAGCKHTVAAAKARAE